MPSPPCWRALRDTVRRKPRPGAEGARIHVPQRLRSSSACDGEGVPSCWAACAACFDAKPGSVALRLLQNVFFSTLIMFFLGLVMTAFMTGIGSAEALNSMTGQMVETNLFDRFVSLCLQFWPTIVIVAMLSDPAAGGLAKLCVKLAKRYAKMPGGAGAPGAPEA